MFDGIELLIDLGLQLKNQIDEMSANEERLVALGDRVEKLPPLLLALQSAPGDVDAQAYGGYLKQLSLNLKDVAAGLKSLAKAKNIAKFFKARKNAAKFAEFNKSLDDSIRDLGAGLQVQTQIDVKAGFSEQRIVNARLESGQAEMKGMLLLQNNKADRDRNLNPVKAKEQLLLVRYEAALLRLQTGRTALQLITHMQQWVMEKGPGQKRAWLHWGYMEGFHVPPEAKQDLNLGDASR